jgi:hypothetical protein
VAHTFKNEGNVYALTEIATALVTRDLVLGATVKRDLGAQFDGKRGQTVNVKVPPTLTARSRDLTNSTATGQYSSITVDSVTESTQSVSLDAQVYHAVDVSVAEQELEIEDYSAEVTAPQVLAIVEDIEERVATEMQGITATPLGGTTPVLPAYSSTQPVKLFTAVRKLLRDRGIPANGLYAAVGTEIYHDLLNAAVLQQVDMSGSSAALRDAVVGRLASFNVFESNRLDEDEAVFYHQDGFVLVLRAPAPPRGGAVGASLSANGVALSLVHDYDKDIMADRQILHTLVGAQPFQILAKGANGSYGLTVPAVRVKLSEVG